jgi:hypothetical protein
LTSRRTLRFRSSRSTAVIVFAFQCESVVAARTPI